MKRISLALVLIFLLCSACGQSTRANKHIKYFGFSLIDTYWDDPTDSEIRTNYLNEVASFSNIADILVLSPNDNIIAKMQNMNNLGVKSILHLTEIFFEFEAKGGLSGVKYKLRHDYKNRWDKFVQTNDLKNNQYLAQAFYIAEEPTWNDISFKELKQASDYIKSSTPKVAIMIIEAYPAIKQLKIPKSVDWVGFDHYFIKDPFNNAEFRAELELLKSKLSSSQKLVFIMDSHYIPWVHGDIAKIKINEMKDVATSYYQLAKSEPKAIAILGYFWPSGFDDKTAIGARHMPTEVMAEYIRIGKEITAK